MNLALRSLLLSAAVALAPAALAQKKQPNPGGGPPTPPAAKKEEPKTGADKVKEKLKPTKEYPGLFTLYRDTTNGNVLMKVKKDQLGKEFIYWSYVENGPVQLGYFRGNFWDNGIFSIRRYYDRIEFQRENTSFYFDPQNAISRAKGANITPALLAVQKIVAEDTTGGELLIEANGIFLSEALTQIKPTPLPIPSPFPLLSLGGLNAGKSRIHALKSYPANTDVVVEYVYDNPLPGFGAEAEITESRAIHITVQHTLIELPQNDYRPRLDDPRVGYFFTQVDDQTSVDGPTNYRDLIHRWHLAKKDPAAAVSEPVEPIVWWIENTTPVELRETIRQAGLAWNKAFEAAGFRNAVDVRIQPDDADWDAGDIRYNVLRWTSSPNPPFGGYGPSFVNPRTGQILGADIMLELTFLANRFNAGKVFNPTTLSLQEQVAAHHQQLAQHRGHDAHQCLAGWGVQMNNMYGMAGLQALRAAELTPEELKAASEELLKESLYYLILHEMGHTLGLNHNMKATQRWAPGEVNNKAVTTAQGLAGSVMDYPAINFARTKAQQGQYYSTTPGAYDVWAIQFGYDPTLDDAARRQALLAQSTRPELTFGNDADDMRAPGKAIDPRVNIFDMTSDAVAFATERMEMSRTMHGRLKDRFSRTGETYQEIVQTYSILRNDYATQAGVVSRYIGGVYVDRGNVGQPGAVAPHRPVPYELQKRAMAALDKYVFAPDAFQTDEALFQYLAPQRRGYNFFATTEDPKLHNLALGMQRAVLAHITHPSVTQRLTDSRQYGNRYSVNEMMTDLTNAIFLKDLATAVNTYRQNLQIEYVKALAGVMGSSDKPSPYDNLTRAVAHGQLKTLQRLLTANPGTGETAVHRQYLRFEIDRALAIN